MGADVFVGANVSTPTGSCFDFWSDEVGGYVAVGLKVGAKVAVGAEVTVGGGVEAIVNVMYWVVVKLWL